MSDKLIKRDANGKIIYIIDKDDPFWFEWYLILNWRSYYGSNF